jgi:hypothetical protein
MVRCTSTVVFACLSKACAPPPVGSGGSKGGAGGTSIVPKDTRPKVAASDSHPHAPGSSDRTAVHGHRGVSGKEPERRIPRVGETVDIYRDLGRGKEELRGFPDKMAFSVRMAAKGAVKEVNRAEQKNTGDVAATTVGIVVTGGRPAWANASKAAAEASGKRGVHAFVRGEVKEYGNPEKLMRRIESEPGWEEVSYYPGTQDFFRRSDRHRWAGSDEVAMVNGKMFARGSKWIAKPAPVSRIEKEMQAKQSLGLLEGFVGPVFG